MAELQQDEPKKPIVEEQAPAPLSKSMSETENKMKKKKNVFGKTFARMQLIQHLNRISGVPTTMSFSHEDAEFLKGDPKANSMHLMPLKDMLKQSKSQSGQLVIDPETAREKDAKQRQIREKILATDGYEKMHPTQKAKLQQEAMRLPKVKSTLHSNPKFLNKSQLLGRSKQIPANFRDSQLNDNNKLDRSRSQLLNIKIK